MPQFVIAIVSFALLSVAWMKVRASRPVAHAAPAGVPGMGAVAFSTESQEAGAAPAAPVTPKAAPAPASPAPSTRAELDRDGDPLPADVVALGLTAPFPDLPIGENLSDVSVGDLLLYAAGSPDGEDDATEVVLGQARRDLDALRSLAMQDTDAGRAIRSVERKIEVAYELHRRQIAAAREAAK